MMEVLTPLHRKMGRTPGGSTPAKSLTIVGSAVPTIVLSSIPGITPAGSLNLTGSERQRRDLMGWRMRAWLFCQRQWAGIQAQD